MALSTAEQFQVFHKDNPHVYDALEDLAWEAQAKGYKRWGISGMYEILRWRGKLRTKGDKDFKLRNDFRAFYARMLLANGVVPEGFFSFRTSQADKMSMPGSVVDWDDWDE
jgi:hypothetical protein